MQNKDDIYFRVCSSILKAEVEKGTLKWSLSQISRDSKVTRSLIYYYFGKNKETILKEAYRFIVESLLTLSPEKIQDHRKVSSPTKLKEFIKKTNHMKYLLVLYYLRRSEDNEIGKLLRNAEESTIKSIQLTYPNFSKHKCHMLFLAEIGAVFCQLKNSQIDDIFSEFKINDL
jgi:hypothetical protein